MGYWCNHETSALIRCGWTHWVVVVACSGLLVRAVGDGLVMVWLISLVWYLLEWRQ